MNSVGPPIMMASGCKIEAALLSIKSRKPYRVYSFSPVAIGMVVALLISWWPL